MRPNARNTSLSGEKSERIYRLITSYHAPVNSVVVRIVVKTDIQRLSQQGVKNTEFVHTHIQQMVINNLKGFLKNFVRIFHSKNRQEKLYFSHLKSMILELYIIIGYIVTLLGVKKPVIARLSKRNFEKARIYPSYLKNRG